MSRFTLIPLSTALAGCAPYNLMAVKKPVR